MNDKERLQLEEELLMTCSKAQAINKYIDELEESSKLSELWCKSQQENARLKDKLKDIEKILDADCCVENVYQAICQYLNIHDFELDLEDYLKEN